MMNHEPIQTPSNSPIEKKNFAMNESRTLSTKQPIPQKSHALCTWDRTKGTNKYDVGTYKYLLVPDSGDEFLKECH